MDKFDFHAVNERFTGESRLDDECPDCGHNWDLHGDRYGCQYERGDRWVDWGQGHRLVAMGPCGCKSVAADVAAGSTNGWEEQGKSSQVSSLTTACMWLRKQGIFL
jgi:hypothetical protein